MPWRLDIINRKTKSRRLVKVISKPDYQRDLTKMEECAVLTRLPNNVVPMAERCFQCNEAIQSYNTIH